MALFYFYSYLAFCIRMLLAALDHNLHSFRPQAATKNGQPIGRNSTQNEPSAGIQNQSELRKAMSMSHT